MKAELFDNYWALDDRTGCWNWQRSCDAWGYGNIYFNKKMTRAHRVSYETKVGPIPEGMLVLHSCDNPACVNPFHLRVGTNADNTKDKMDRGRGRFLRKEQSPSAKITQGTADRIRDIYRLGGSTQQKIAEYFGIDQTNVSLIVINKTWVPA